MDPTPRTDTRERARTLGVVVVCLLAVGCRSYHDRTQGAFDDFVAGRFDRARTAYADTDTTGSSFLSGAESGMAALTAGDWDAAQAGFDRAVASAKDLEDKALLSPEALGQGLSALAVNESMQDYKGEGYERVMVHAALALTYLARGQLEGVAVETRLSNRLLESEEKLYEKEYRAGGFGHFLSAVAYELLGEYDQAYIDYERMVAKDVGVELAGPALVRIARLLGYDDELGRWTDRFGDEPSPPRDYANVIVVAGEGLGPYKAEKRLTIPTPDGLLQWAVPSIQARPGESTAGEALRVTATGSGIAVRTVVVEDVVTVARENLDDRIAWLAGRSAVRSVLKRSLTKHLQKKNDLAGRLAGDLFTLFTERADLRSWTTLPATWQAARMFLPPGEHEIVLEAVGGERRPLGTFRLEEGETMFVLARTVRGRLYCHPIGGAQVGPEPDLEP